MTAAIISSFLDYGDVSFKVRGGGGGRVQRQGGPRVVVVFAHFVVVFPEESQLFR